MKTACRLDHPIARMLFLWLTLIIILSSCTPGKTSQPVSEPAEAISRPVVINTLHDLQTTLKEIDQAEPAEAQLRADELWQTLVDTGRVPLVLGTQVFFLYKGEADQVNWRGSFNAWNEPGVDGYKVGETDLWMGTMEFPQASRAEYKIVINGDEWLVDPANPRTAFSGLTGANNVVTLPGFRVTDESQKRSDMTPGTLIGNLSIDSRFLGYTVNYWVYTPAGYEDLENLPVVYVLDGNDFVDERMGALPNVLDNMIADRRIEPVLAVFIDARDPENAQYNRREEEFIAHPMEHARFVAEELVPLIDQSYHTNPLPERRVIMGVSFGGLSSIYIAAYRPDVFHGLAAFSPSLWALYNPEYLPNGEQQKGSAIMRPTIDTAGVCGEDTGFACPRLPVSVFITAGLPAWDVGDLGRLVAGLDQQGYPIEFHQVNEGHTWDNWRGLLDEMLVYFFGVD